MNVGGWSCILSMEIKDDLSLEFLVQSEIFEMGRVSEWRDVASRWKGLQDKDDSRKIRCGRGSRMDYMGVVDFSGEALGSLDICHHPDEGQILTEVPNSLGYFGTFSPILY